MTYLNAPEPDGLTEADREVFRRAAADARSFGALASAWFFEMLAELDDTPPSRPM